MSVGLRQGCVIAPWLFNVYMDGGVREVNVRVFMKGLELLRNGGRFEIKVKSSMARSLPVENLLPQNVGSIINYLQ